MADALSNADCEVKAVEAQIAAVEKALLEPNADISYLRKEKDQLRKKEEQIRKEKEQILNGINLDKEILNIELKIRQSPGTRPCKQLSSYFLLFYNPWFNSDVL